MAVLLPGQGLLGGLVGLGELIDFGGERIREVLPPRSRDGDRLSDLLSQRVAIICDEHRLHNNFQKSNSHLCKTLSTDIADTA